MAGQNKIMSLIESGISVVTGYVLTVLVQCYLYPLFGIFIPVSDALMISVLVVAIAFVKNFGVRRLFNYLYLKGVS